MYKFTREDFQKVVDDERFINGVKFAINECFFPDKFYQGDKKLFDGVKREEYWNIIQTLPLPYISLCEDLKQYEEKYGKSHQTTLYVKQDTDDRNYLLEKAKDKYDPEWWCLIHNCQAVAVFIIFPLLKILYPHKEFYLYDGIIHTVIVNAPLPCYQNISSQYTRDINQPCVFDLISQCVDENLDLVFPNMDSLNSFERIIAGGKNSFHESRLIKAENIIDWYIASFDCVDSSKFMDWYNSL